MSADHLETAAKMFIYLNTCPGKLKSWFLFYKYLFETESLDKILLTLNRMMKSSRIEKHHFLTTISKKVFMNMYQYEILKKIPGNGEKLDDKI